jgi:hypothetical protein
MRQNKGLERVIPFGQIEARLKRGTGATGFSKAWLARLRQWFDRHGFHHANGRQAERFMAGKPFNGMAPGFAGIGRIGRYAGGTGAWHLAPFAGRINLLVAFIWSWQNRSRKISLQKNICHGAGDDQRKTGCHGLAADQMVFLFQPGETGKLPSVAGKMAVLRLVPGKIGGRRPIGNRLRHRARGQPVDQAPSDKLILNHRSRVSFGLFKSIAQTIWQNSSS